MSDRALFSPAVSEAGFEIGNELAWHRSSALAALKELAGHGRAVLGGELWTAHEGQVFPWLPTLDGRKATVGWECDRRMGQEPWDAYVARSVAEATQKVLCLPEAHPELEPQPEAALFYNFTFASEAEYPGAA